MAGEKKIENVYKADPIIGLAKQEVTSTKDGTPSELNTSKATPKGLTSVKGETDQGSVGVHGASLQPSSYSYYYQGYNGSYPPVDELGYYNPTGSNAGMQLDNGSMYYYVPGYGPYASGGAVMGVDGQQGIGPQQYYSSAGYPQQPVSYGSEALSCYSWDQASYVRDVPSNGTSNTFLNGKSALRSPGLAKSFNPAKANGTVNGKFTKPLTNTPTMKTLHKFSHEGTDYIVKALSQVGQLPTFTSQKQNPYPQSSYTSYKPYSARVWNGNDRFKPTKERNVDFEASAELTRGPRSRRALSDPAVEKEEAGLVSVHREQYNLPEFQTDLEKAKFYVIKSYSEDDIHKCIKYNVWASTPNGNKKLDAAFREKDPNCPIFLFFSVNGSGQFVGVAEMIGQVDFEKDMEFWQVDKWNGFFPVAWHVVKDVPNSQLRHIILENNENKSVTFTRDTQEVGLKQGVEMLNIFKSYAQKTSLLDDFGFYETREKSLNAKRGLKPATLKVESIVDKHERNNMELESASLVNLTKNLSLNNGSA